MQRSPLSATSSKWILTSPVMRARPHAAENPGSRCRGPTADLPCLVFHVLAWTGSCEHGAHHWERAIWSHRQVTARGPRGAIRQLPPRADYEISRISPAGPSSRPLLTHVSEGGHRRGQVESVLDRFEARVALLPCPGFARRSSTAIWSWTTCCSARISGGLIVDFRGYDPCATGMRSRRCCCRRRAARSRDDAIEAADTLIGGYVSVTPLEDDEAGLLADLVAARLAAEITVAAWRLGATWICLHMARAASRGLPRLLLDAIEEMGIDAVARRFREACRRSLPKVCHRRPARAPPSGAALIAAVLRPPGAIWSAARVSDCSTPTIGGTSTRYNNVAVVGHSHPRVAQAGTQQQRLLATHSYLQRSWNLSSSPNGSNPPCRRSWTPSWS